MSITFRVHHGTPTIVYRLFRSHRTLSVFLLTTLVNLEPLCEIVHDCLSQDAFTSACTPSSHVHVNSPKRPFLSVLLQPPARLRPSDSFPKYHSLHLCRLPFKRSHVGTTSKFFCSPRPDGVHNSNPHLPLLFDLDQSTVTSTHPLSGQLPRHHSAQPNPRPFHFGNHEGPRAFVTREFVLNVGNILLPSSAVPETNLFSYLERQADGLGPRVTRASVEKHMRMARDESA